MHDRIEPHMSMFELNPRLWNNTAATMIARRAQLGQGGCLRRHPGGPAMTGEPR